MSNDTPLKGLTGGLYLDAMFKITKPVVTGLLVAVGLLAAAAPVAAATPAIAEGSHWGCSNKA